MRTLSVDIESFSSVDLGACGLHKYMESPDFEILLIGYSFDGGPVRVHDCTKPGCWPRDLLDALTDPNVLKTAFNAAFERTAFATALEEEMPPEQWSDTMVMALEMGLPGSLAAAGAALGLPEDQLKDPIGKSLIQYFSKPCRATKSNGGRRRNLPEHDPEKWKLYTEYNRQDVVTEMAIRKKLLPLAESEQRLWCLDQRMNDHGVRIDVPMVEKIVAFDEKRRRELQEEAQELSGLDNPNSLAQLKGWLAKEGVSVETLRKDDLAALLSQDLPEKVRRVLEIRRALGKTSTAKYGTMLGAVCRDGRLRGILQFYGANRSGRWCLTGDHEVLTPDGWVPIKDWHGGRILCWNPTTDALSFAEAKQVSFPYHGEMYHTANQRIDQIATPDHKMAVLGPDGRWTPETMENIAKRRVNVPFTGVRNTSPENGENWALRLLIATQADGHFTEDGSVRFHLKKERKIERLKHLLRMNQLPFVASKHTDGNTTITIRAKWVPLWLRQFRNKVFDYWLLDENLGVLFNEIEHWDGYRSAPNSIQYVTAVKQNADVIQACALCHGYNATILKKRRSEKNWGTGYVVSIWEAPGRGARVLPEQTEIITNDIGLVYCAETTTGYFAVRRNGKMWITGNSGRLVQTHNLARNALPDLDLARQLAAQGDFETLETLFGETSFVFSELVRTAFIPSPGCRFCVSDFSAIEARVIAWIAGEEWVLDAFRNGKDIYCETASMMYHVPVVKHGVNGELRQKGKIATLACGYQGGVGAMKAMDSSGTIPEEEMQSIVDHWRQANPMIVKLWRDYEAAAKTAITEKRTVRRGIRIPAANLDAREHMAEGPVRPYSVRSGVCVEFSYKNGNLMIKLPSGRSLCYWHARIRSDGWKDSIVYMGVNQTTKQWQETETYGGKIVENIVQATARDCLAEAMQRVTDMGYQIVMHVHDEMIVDVRLEDKDALARINKAMSDPIDWAPGLPLRGDGYETPFYKKD